MGGGRQVKGCGDIRTHDFTIVAKILTQAGLLQCNHIRLFCKVLGDKVSYKSGQKSVTHWAIFIKHQFYVNTAVATFCNLLKVLGYFLL